MLKLCNDFIIACSKSWWKFLLLVAGQIVTMGIMMGWINREFPTVSDGNVPFDMQNNLTVEQIFTQLESYTDRAFDLYAIFQAVDYVFPVVAGLVLATVCAFGLRNTSARLYAVADKRNLFLLILIPAVFDWSENLNLLCVIIAWPEQIEVAARMAVLSKQGKLASMNIGFAITGVLLITGVTGWVRKKFSA
jgi:hypothetical protein